MEFIEKLPDVYEGRFKYDWESIATDLKANPGQWGRVDSELAKNTASSASGTVSHINRGAVKQMPRGQFIATRRGPVIWAKYVGE